MIKQYNPCEGVSYILYSSKRLIEASGDIGNIKELCDIKGIDYSKCVKRSVNGVQYLEVCEDAYKVKKIR